MPAEQGSHSDEAIPVAVGTARGLICAALRAAPGTSSTPSTRWLRRATATGMPFPRSKATPGDA